MPRQRLAPILAALTLAGPCEAASLTPPNLVTASTLNNPDLLLVWPYAAGGPLEAMSWSTFKGQMASGLAGSFLTPANNLLDLANPTIARSNLGLGTAALVNTGTSGGNVPLLNFANTWSAAQTFSVAPVFTDQSGSRTALGLGTAATQNTGTSGAALCLVNTACVFSTQVAIAVTNGNNALRITNSSLTGSHYWIFYPTTNGTDTDLRLFEQNATAGDRVLFRAGGETDFTGLVKAVAATTGGASINIPPGVAPTSPNSGDVWTTTAGVFARINSTTLQLAPTATPTLTGATLNGSTAIGNADANVMTVTGHEAFSGAAISTSGTCASEAGTDMRGSAAGVSSTSCTVIFGQAFASTPVCVLQSSNTLLTLGVTAISTTGFTVSNPSNFSATFYWICMG
jgi:hypothetical protein